jgi:OOP family OmpA-OmpF porin
LTPVSYGSAKPVAANYTDDGKAQNRRIEFVVR